MAFTLRRSSGLFGLPANAVAVDWAMVNDTTSRQKFRVTVYKGGVGVAKTPAPPGPLEMTLDPSFVSHNANSVGPGAPFQHGFYYEVVVESNHKDVLPSVEVWQDNGGTMIPGTLIPPRDFVVVG